MAAVAAVLLGLWWYLDYQSRGRILQSTNGATIEAHSVIVAPKVGGYIGRVFVAENQTIRVGQPLPLLGMRDYPLHQLRVGSDLEPEVSRSTSSAHLIKASFFSSK